MADINYISSQLAELQRSMGRVEANTAAMLLGHEDHDKRLRKVEGRLHWYSGAAACAGAIFTFVVNRLTGSHA